MQEVLHALWQDAWHLPQPPVLAVFFRFPSLIVFMCFIFVLLKSWKNVKICTFCTYWLGYCDSNTGMSESESDALPLGDTPIFFITVKQYHIEKKKAIKMKKILIFYEKNINFFDTMKI